MFYSTFTWPRTLFSSSPVIVCLLVGNVKLDLTDFHKIQQKGGTRATEEKKRSERRRKRRNHCALAVVSRSQKKFAPSQTPFPGAQDDQNLISWRRSLPSPTEYRPSLVKIDARNFELVLVVTDPQTHTPTHKHTPPARPPQTGPITIHCAAKLIERSVTMLVLVIQLR